MNGGGPPGFVGAARAGGAAARASGEGDMPLRPQLDLSFVPSHRGTVIDRRMFRWPFAISRTFHLDDGPPGLLTVLIQSVSGAITSNDLLLQRFHVAAGACVHVGTPSAVSVHRAMPGQGAVDVVELDVADGGYFEYLPEPRILFPASSLAQQLRLRIAPGGRALLADAFTAHDPASSGGSFRRFASEIRIATASDEILALDRIDLGGCPQRSGRRGRYTAFGTLMLVAMGEQGDNDRLRDAFDAQLADVEGVYWSLSPLPNGAGVALRVSAIDGRWLRLALSAGHAIFRQMLSGEAPRPRVR